MKQSNLTILLSVVLSVAASCGVLVGDRYLSSKSETPETAPAGQPAETRPVVNIQPGSYPDFT